MGIPVTDKRLFDDNFERVKERIVKTKQKKELMQECLEMERKYFTEQRKEGKNIRKKKEQYNVLMAHFSEDPNWSYRKKVKIASEIGMTFNQVSKWNWDQRRKQGI